MVPGMRSVMLAELIQFTNQKLGGRHHFLGGLCLKVTIFVEQILEKCELVYPLKHHLSQGVWRFLFQVVVKFILPGWGLQLLDIALPKAFDQSIVQTQAACSAWPFWVGCGFERSTGGNRWPNMFVQLPMVVDPTNMFVATVRCKTKPSALRSMLRSHRRVTGSPPGDTSFFPQPVYDMVHKKNREIIAAIANGLCVDFQLYLHHVVSKWNKSQEIEMKPT